jgi:osmotically inducible protein OsmC
VAGAADELARVHSSPLGRVPGRGSGLGGPIRTTGSEPAAVEWEEVGHDEALHGRGDRVRGAYRTGRRLGRAARLELSRPRERGGDGVPGTNPEQLVAAGYAACFHSAMRPAAAELGLPADVLRGSRLTARVHFHKDGPIDVGPAVELELTAPGLPPDRALAVLERTHTICPYSRATAGNGLFRI